MVLKAELSKPVLFSYLGQSPSRSKEEAIPDDGGADERIEKVWDTFLMK